MFDILVKQYRQNKNTAAVITDQFTSWFTLFISVSEFRVSRPVSFIQLRSYRLRRSAMNHSKFLITLYARYLPSTKCCWYAANQHRTFLFNHSHVSNRLTSQTASRMDGENAQPGTDAAAIWPKASTMTVAVDSGHENSLLITANTSFSALSDSQLSTLGSNAPKLTEDDILNLIASSNREPVVNDTCLSIISHLENECIYRARRWDIETFLRFYKRYYDVGLIRNSKFPMYAVRSRSKYVFNRCSLPLILEFLHLVNNTINGQKTRFNKCDVEHVLLQHLDVLKPDQVALFIHFLSSSGKNLRSDQLKKNLCTWFASQASTHTEDVVKAFTSLFAGPDSTNPLFITPWLVRAFKAIDGRLHEFSLNCLSGIALTCSRRMIVDQDILEKVASSLLNALPCANLADIESTVTALVSLNYHPRSCDLYSKLVEHMCRQPLYSQLRENPRILCRILTQLSFIDIYPYRLLSLNFSEQCLRRSYKRLSKYNVPYEIRMLLGGLRIERPDYKGWKVGFNMVRYDTRKHRLSFPKVLRVCEPTGTEKRSAEHDSSAPRELSPYNRVLHSTRNSLNHLFGSTECTHICFVLPHSSRANIIFATSRAKEPQKLPPNVRQDLLLKYRDLDMNDLEYYVVVFRSKNIYMDYEPLFMGEDIAKTRQIQHLGFKTISLVQHGWFKVELRETLTILRKVLQEEGIVLPRHTE